MHKTYRGLLRLPVALVGCFVLLHHLGLTADLQLCDGVDN